MSSSSSSVKRTGNLGKDGKDVREGKDGKKPRTEKKGRPVIGKREGKDSEKDVKLRKFSALNQTRSKVLKSFKENGYIKSNVYSFYVDTDPIHKELKDSLGMLDDEDQNNPSLVDNIVKAEKVQGGIEYHNLFVFSNENISRKDPSRVQYVLPKEVDCPDIVKQINKFVDNCFSWMTLGDGYFSCKKENREVAILKTVKMNLGQVPHFDWQNFRVPHMTKIRNQWKLNDSMSAVIQLEGESTICIHKSVLKHVMSKFKSIVKNLEKEDDFEIITSAEVMTGYADPGEDVDIESITLTKGQILIFF